MRIDPAKITIARGKRSVSQLAFELSQHMKKPVPTATIYQWENGTNGISDDYLQAMIAVTGKPISFFYPQS